MIAMPFFLIWSMQESWSLPANALLLKLRQSSLKSLLTDFMTSTAHWMSLETNVTSYSQKFIKTAIFQEPEMTKSFIMTVRITTLRLNKRMAAKNMAKVKNTDPIQSFKWDYLWMEMVFLLLFLFSLEIPMNKLL